MHVAQLCDFRQESHWLRPIQWMAVFPYEARGVPPYEARGVPAFILFGWRWHGWKLVPGLRCFPLCHLCPPLDGGALISQQLQLCDRGW